MKLLVILLFLFELLAPACYASVFEKTTDQEASTSTLLTSAHSAGWLSLALFEESTSEEEREDKGDALFLVDSCLCIELFSTLQKFEPVNVTYSRPKEHFDVHPPLFTLHCVYTI